MIVTSKGGWRWRLTPRGAIQIGGTRRILRRHAERAVRSIEASPNADVNLPIYYEVTTNFNTIVRSEQRLGFHLLIVRKSRHFHYEIGCQVFSQRTSQALRKWALSE